MAQQDAYIKEVDLLQHLASQLRNSIDEVEIRCGLIRSALYSKRDELQQQVYRVKDAREEAYSRLACARQEYSDYMDYNDPEDYSDWEINDLRAAIDEAKDRRDECNEDFDTVRDLYQRAAIRLEQLDTYTQSFQPLLESNTATACHTILQAAHDITQYKSVR